MFDPLLPLGEGHTELDPDEQAGLRLTYITTRGELNDAEQRSIAAALLRRRPPTWQELFDDVYLRALHKAMFAKVWTWAGKYRTKETNIGVDPIQIAVMVRELVADGRRGRSSPPSSLTSSSCGSTTGRSGSTRSSTVTAATAASPPTTSLERSAGRRSAGVHTAVTQPKRCEAYLDALRSADRDDPGPLILFARS